MKFGSQEHGNGSAAAAGVTSALRRPRKSYNVPFSASRKFHLYLCFSSPRKGHSPLRGPHYVGAVTQHEAFSTQHLVTIPPSRLSPCHLPLHKGGLGERRERRRGREERPERVAAVGRKRACFDRRSFCRGPQQFIVATNSFEMYSAKDDHGLKSNKGKAC